MRNFSAEKNVEFRRLQSELAKSGPDSSAARNIKFLGCAMESVRSSPAELFRRVSAVSDLQGSNLTQFDWNPLVPHEKI